MKPMSWLWGSLFSRRLWLWRRGRLGWSMLDCCLRREPRAEVGGLRAAAFSPEPAAKGDAAVRRVPATASSHRPASRLLGPIPEVNWLLGGA